MIHQQANRKSEAFIFLAAQSIVGAIADRRARWGSKAVAKLRAGKNRDLNLNEILASAG